MTTTTFTPSLATTLTYFAVSLIMTVASATGAVLAAGLPPLAGAAWVLSVIGVVASCVLAYRLIARPVMVSVGPEGLYIRRLGTTLPWESIAQIEAVHFKGSTLFSVVETPDQHPVFDEQSMLLGRALNEKAGLPALAIAMHQYSGTPEAFAAAVTAIGRVPLVYPDESTDRLGR